MGKKIKYLKIIGVFVFISVLIILIVNKNTDINNIFFNNKEGAVIENNYNETRNEIEDNNVIELEAEERVETISVMAIGDLLMHIDIVAAQYDYQNGIYNFDDNFKYIKDYINSSDLAIANLETTLAGEEYGYSGYPCFNTPAELIDSVKKIGIDVISNMSNHTLDKGEVGFWNTRTTLKEKGVDIIGSRDSESDKRYLIKNVKDIKLGIICYSYNTEGINGGRGLNGIPIPDNLMPLMNTFNPYDLENDLVEMKKQIDLMKEENVDSIIFYMHWGEEYQLEPNESQLKIAEFLANEDVDIIFGDHPHTIQPIDIISSSDNDHKTVVFYSLGNFISSQRLESIGNEYTEDGVIASVDITKNFKTGEIEIGIPEYLPTWVKLESYNGHNYYTVVQADFNDAEYLYCYESERVIQSFNRTTGIVESYTDVADVFSEQ